MTNFTTRMMIAAATLVVAAGSASAQTLNAEIPFPFRANGVVMAAGTYQVRAVNGRSGHPVFLVGNKDGGRSILFLAGAPHDAQKAWAATGQPVLSFQCGTGPCALAEVWAGRGMPSYNVPRPRLGRDEPTRTAVVVMQYGKGE